MLHSVSQERGHGRAAQRPDKNSYRGNVKNPHTFRHVYLLVMHNLRNLNKQNWNF